MNKRSLLPIVVRDLVCGASTYDTFTRDWDKNLYADLYNAGVAVAAHGSPTDIEVAIRTAFDMQTNVLSGMSPDPIRTSPAVVTGSKKQGNGKPAGIPIVTAVHDRSPKYPDLDPTTPAPSPLSWVDPIAAQQCTDDLIADLGNGGTQYPLRALTQPDLESLIGSCRSHIADYSKTLADAEAALIWRKDRASAVAASRAKAASRDALQSSIDAINALPIPQSAKDAAIAVLQVPASTPVLPAGVTVESGINFRDASTFHPAPAPTAVPLSSGMVKVATAREAAVPGFSEPLAHAEARRAGILAVPSDPKLALEYVRGYSAATPTATAPILTARESAVSRAAASGATNKQIAATLNVATGTVKAAARTVKAKVGGNTRAATVLAATVPAVAAATNVNVNALITRLAGPGAKIANGKYDVAWNPTNAAAFNALSPADRHTFTLRARFIPTK